MITPTGRSVVLESGRVRAEIGTVAAVLRSLTVDGVDLVEPTREGHVPQFGNGTVLVPWPNRVKDARWRHDGEELLHAVTEPARGNALHGLLRTADYEIGERTDRSVVLGAIIPPQTGWPFFLDTWVRYELEEDGIAVTHGAVNLSGESAPWAVGTHPFLRVGDVPVEDLVLTLPADGYVDVDDRLNPVGFPGVDGTAFDLRGGRRVGELTLDTAFHGLRHANVASGHGDAAWVEAPDGTRTTLWQDTTWGYVQVFTTDAWEGARGRHRRALAVEPMTAPPDALNSGRGLQWIEAGGAWEGSWGLRRS